MNKHDARLANLLGALALGVTDRMREAVLDETNLAGETSAAIVVIGHAPGLSINQLSRALQLSHAGAVRLIDRLGTAGLVTRGQAAHDRRVAVLQLTCTGEDQRSAILSRREQVLAPLLDNLEAEDRVALARITQALLRAMPTSATSALTVCRLCDNQQCTDCPMAEFGVLDIQGGTHQ